MSDDTFYHCLVSFTTDGRKYVSEFDGNSTASVRETVYDANGEKVVEYPAMNHQRNKP